MRLKLTLSPLEKETCIPLNYPYALSAWVYQRINAADAAYADFLHSQGYGEKHRAFKLFTFSPLKPTKYRIKGDRMEILPMPVALGLSFFVGEAAEKFIMGVFERQRFTIGDRKSEGAFEVSQVQMEPTPKWEENMQYYAGSPIVLSRKEGKREIYAEPTDVDFTKLLLHNLIGKAEAVDISTEGSENWEVILDNNAQKARSRLVAIKAGRDEATKVRGFYNFGFSLKAPAEIQRLGYLAGFGKQNAQGFGYCEFIKERVSNKSVIL